MHPNSFFIICDGKEVPVNILQAHFSVQPMISSTSQLFGPLRLQRVMLQGRLDLHLLLDYLFPLLIPQLVSPCSVNYYHVFLIFGTASFGVVVGTLCISTLIDLSNSYSTYRASARSFPFLKHLDGQMTMSCHSKCKSFAFLFHISLRMFHVCRQCSIWFTLQLSIKLCHLYF